MGEIFRDIQEILHEQTLYLMIERRILTKVVYFEKISYRFDNIFNET